MYAHAYHAYRTYNTSCNFLLDTFLVISLVMLVVCRFIVICIYFHLIFSNHDITFLATRVAVAFSKINTFNLSQEDWPLYIERLGHVFVANGITEDAKKRAVFLSVIGASTYTLLSSLLAPDKPGEKAYETLVEKLKYLLPLPLR